MLDETITKSIEENFGSKVINSELIPSYFKRVWEITTDTDQTFVIKVLNELKDEDLQRYRAIFEFCDIVNNQIQDIKTVVHIKNLRGKILQEYKTGHYYVLMEKHQIIRKDYLSPEEIHNLGHLMSEVHEKLKDLNIFGLGKRGAIHPLTEEGLKLLEKDFPDKGFLPFVDLMKPLDHEQLGLNLTVIHGDWQPSNISFTDPPFLFDFDNLTGGAGIEDLARTIVHWNMGSDQIAQFYINLLSGYRPLTENEKYLLPKLIMAQLYAKHAEFYEYGDPDSAAKIKDSIPHFKAALKID